MSDSDTLSKPSKTSLDQSGLEPKVPFYKNPYLIAFVIGIIVLTGIRPFLRRVPQAPPVQGLAPSFSLTDQLGAVVTSSDLKGTTYVASFLFSSCTTVCPIIMQGLSELQQRYKRDNIPIRIVSFTVDPTTDTPEVLKLFADKANVDHSRWQFLTGEPEVVREVLKGFKFDLEPKIWTKNSFFEIAHTQKLVIVDGNGAVRGYYGSDKQGIDEVFHRSQHVLNSQSHESGLVVK